MKVNLYSLDGKVVGEVELPPIFEELYRPDLIARAVLAEESRLYQPKGNYRWAGMETSADYVGRKEVYKSLKNRGQSRLPREFFGGGIPGRVRRIPSAVGGRRAHPPKPEKRIEERINKKEWAKALRSALNATTQLRLVRARGHKVGDVTVPFIVVDEIEGVEKVKDLYAILKQLAPEDLERAEKRQRVTGVRRKRKGRAYRVPKSFLIVVSDDAKVLKADNIPGVDVVPVSKLQVRHLAPGTHAGRLTVFSQKALKALEARMGGGHE